MRSLAKSEESHPSKTKRSWTKREPKEDSLISSLLAILNLKFSHAGSILPTNTWLAGLEMELSGSTILRQPRLRSLCALIWIWMEWVMICLSLHSDGDLKPRPWRLLMFWWQLTLMDSWSIGMPHQESASIKDNARTTQITNFTTLISTQRVTS